MCNEGTCASCRAGNVAWADSWWGSATFGRGNFQIRREVKPVQFRATDNRPRNLNMLRHVAIMAESGSLDSDEGN